jgi:hypothetical protein
MPPFLHSIHVKCTKMSRYLSDFKYNLQGLLIHPHHLHELQESVYRHHGNVHLHYNMLIGRLIRYHDILILGV